MTNKKHLFVAVGVTHGEYSHLSDTVATVEAHVDLARAGEIVAKNWQETPGTFLNGEWVFDDGTAVMVSKVVEVLPEEFEVLKKYLGEFQIKTQNKQTEDWSRN